MTSRNNAPLHRLASPLRLFFSLLLIIFGIEMFIMYVILPNLFGDAEGVAVDIADASLLALLVAPFLWLRIVRPLRNAALKEVNWTKAVLENVVDGVAILDQKGVIESFNAAAEAMFGYTAPEVSGVRMKSLLPEGDIIFGSEETGFGSNREIVGRRKDGLLFSMDLSVSGVCVGEQWMYICIMRDISQRKQAEKEIRRLNEELEEKVVELTRMQEDLIRKEKLATLGQLAGSVGHEIRNPLGVINNAVYFLNTVMPDADETVKEYLEIIRSEVDNSQRIITDLLDFARTRSPGIQSVMPATLIDNCLKKYAIPGNVSFSVDLPEILPRMEIDPLQMEQVLQNLITNSVQAMPEGGTVRIRAREVRGVEENNIERAALKDKPGGDFVEISFTDTGAGISPENMKKLFQPLFTTKARGIGLGLVVCKNLVEANGGRIEVESRLGEGTVITLLLPGCQSTK